MRVKIKVTPAYQQKELIKRLNTEIETDTNTVKLEYTVQYIDLDPYRKASDTERTLENDSIAETVDE